MRPEVYHTQLMARIQQSLTDILNNNSKAIQLISAMQYSTLNGGKRIRPMLTIAAGIMFGAREDTLTIVGIAIELIHCYSLIHDDLPAMDNDDLRRGKPTCHKQYNEATAILAGDALQCLAFETLSKPNLVLDNEIKLQIINMLALASGRDGMVGGQTIDLANTGRLIDQTELQQMHEMKTGALIKNSLLAGYLCSNNFNQSTYNDLANIATKLGLLFQIIDDIIDVTGNTATLGKTAQKDLLNHKATYVTIMGLDASQQYANTLYGEIINSIQQYNNANFLLYLIDIVFKRNK